MGWASQYITALQQGDTVEFRPKGNSMSGKIESGELVRVLPIAGHEIKKGDIVLCRVRGREFLHLVKAVRKYEVLIGNNKGGINGWTRKSNIYGIKR